jgi:hypothetical protein
MMTGFLVGVALTCCAGAVTQEARERQRIMAQSSMSENPKRSIVLPRLRWTQILAISIFWFALNFHWSALGIIILLSQVFKLLGFQLLFAMAIIYCIVGTVTVRYIRGAR